MKIVMSWRRWLQPRHVLPLMIFLSVLVVGMRLNEAWNMLDGKIFHAVSRAYAESDKPAPDAASTPAPPAAADDKHDAEKATQAAATPTPPEEDNSEELITSRSEMALVKELTDRRGQLDQRSKALDTREALIKVAEQRVDQKIKEMEVLRTQLQAMVNQASAAQQQQLDNLVKIYETMKPPEAAKIFETLELPVLLGVVQKMKPARTAAVMAAMAPEKAKEITVALTKQDQLPQVK